MLGARVVAGASAVFAVGVVAVVVATNRYRDAYAWVEHTSDVRLVIGAPVGHAGRARSCEGLWLDVATFENLTRDSPLHQ